MIANKINFIISLNLKLRINDNISIEVKRLSIGSDNVDGLYRFLGIKEAGNNLVGLPILK